MQVIVLFMINFIIMKKFVFLLFVCMVCFSACEKENHDNSMLVSSPPNASFSASGKIRLGAIVEDPYKISNMIAAKTVLESQGVTFPFATVPATGYYVKAILNSVSQMELLDQDTSIVWFDYPLDREILSGGEYYQVVDEDNPMIELFAVIPTNYRLPNGVYYDTLYSVFIPEDYYDYKSYSSTLDRLESVSDSLCSGSMANNSKAIKTTRRATISSWDEKFVDYVPVKGVTVVAKYKTKTSKAVTDENGYCQFGKKFKGNIEYSVIWKGDGWKQSANWFMASSYKDNRVYPGDFELNLRDNHVQLMRASIHRGCYVAFLGSEWEVDRPKRFGHTLTIMYHNYKDTTTANRMGFSNIHPATSINFDYDIELFGFDYYDNPQEAYYAMGTTLHELAHWSHRKTYGSTFASVISSFIAESWPVCVEWSTMNQIYSSLNNPFGNLGYKQGLQEWGVDRYGTYTPVFIDLIDSYNQSVGNSSRIDDNISGYTINEIMTQIIPYVHNVATLSARLKAIKLHGESDDDIDNLLQKYVDNNL